MRTSQNSVVLMALTFSLPCIALATILALPSNFIYILVAGFAVALWRVLARRYGFYRLHQNTPTLDKVTLAFWCVYVGVLVLFVGTLLSSVLLHVPSHEVKLKICATCMWLMYLKFEIIELLSVAQRMYTKGAIPAAEMSDE